MVVHNLLNNVTAKLLLQYFFSVRNKTVNSIFGSSPSLTVLLCNSDERIRLQKAFRTRNIYKNQQYYFGQNVERICESGLQSLTFNFQGPLWLDIYKYRDSYLPNLNKIDFTIQTLPSLHFTARLQKTLFSGPLFDNVHLLFNTLIKFSM